MKKTYNVPTIEKMDFILSDKTMCNMSTVTTDWGTQNVIAESQVVNMTE